MAAYTTIDDPSLYFQIATWTGTGSSNSITLPGDTDMQPDLSWIKSRNSTSSHCINDSVRGVANGNTLHSNNDGAEDTSNTDAVDSFDSDGVTLGADSGNLGVNYSSSQNYVGWFWKESTTSGLDIIDYDGSGSNATVSHNLSAVPKTIWVKEYSHSTNWAIYHQGAGNTNFLKFNNTNSTEDTDNWQDTDPTSSVFSIGSGGQTNNSGRDYIAYCFAEKQGYSKFGTYVGTGANDGPVVWTGFRPAMVIYKRRGGTEGWMIQDGKRPGYNPIGGNLFPNSDGGESTDARFDFLSNGFKARSGNQNSDESTPYIYMAWAEAPFVNSNGVPCNAR